MGHLEDRLGKLVDGWARSADGERLPFQVSRFENGRFGNVLSFSTIGLSLFGLKSPRSDRELYIELMMINEHIGERNIPALLQQVGSIMLQSGKAILRGDVMDLAGDVVDGTLMTALYATIPVYFEDEFGSCVADNDREVAIVWLIPIHQSECDILRRQGWLAFEEALALQNPDLFDPSRAPIGASSV